MYKARARCLGILYADALCGLPIYEDIRDNPPERKEPKDVPVNDPLLASPVAGENPDVPPQGVSTAETAGDAGLYKDYLNQLETCLDIPAVRVVAGLIKQSKEDGKLSEDQLADLRNKRTEVEETINRRGGA